ncbi:MAG: efflux RND transporter periplasmic adaptor subunit [Pseudomonadota bacterium]
MSEHTSNGSPTSGDETGTATTSIQGTGQAMPKLSAAVSSFLWACLFAGATAAWLMQGDIIAGGQTEAGTGAPAIANADKQRDAAPPFRVRVVRSVAQPRPAQLVLRGRTQVEARVSIRAETAGPILAEPPERGNRVTVGDVLCRIDTGTRTAALLEAKAQLAEAQAAYKATSRLNQRGFASQLKRMGDRRALDTATAAVDRTERDIAKTRITAPMAGVVEHRARLGAYLSVGDECAKLVRLDPLLIVANVAERDVPQLTLGMDVTAQLVTGQQVAGTVQFIAPAADPATRTFRIEAAVPNPEGALRDGLTADLLIPLPSQPAHRLAQSTLSLDDAGRLGVKTVTAEDQVAFVPVTIMGDARDSLWVAGLPEAARVITVGQEYVRDGQVVTPVSVQQTASARGLEETTAR